MGTARAGAFEIKKLLNIAAVSAVLSLLAAGFAEATTYISSRSVGDGSVALSITTDGALGVLKTENILDWTFVLTLGGIPVTANGANSNFTVNGGALSATATELLFDYSSVFDRVRVTTSEAVSSDQSWWCIQGTGQACVAGTGGGAGEFISVAPFRSYSLASQKYSGVQAIASISGAVPEPATWAMMITGFSLAGAAIRRRRQTLVAA